VWCDGVLHATADSYLKASFCEADAAAELVASHKVAKFAGLSSQGEFVPIAVDSRGSIEQQRCSSVIELGR